MMRDNSPTFAEKARSIKSADPYSKSNNQDAKRLKHLPTGVENLRTHKHFPASPVPEFARKVLPEGGLIERYKKNEHVPWTNLGISNEKVSIK